MIAGEQAAIIICLLYTYMCNFFQLALTARGLKVKRHFVIAHKNFYVLPLFLRKSVQSSNRCKLTVIQPAFKNAW